MNERPIIAVDAMGGDFGPSVVVPGAIEAARLHDLHVLLVGDTPKLEAELAKIDLGIACVIKDFVADDLKSGLLVEIPTPQAIHPREIVFAWKKGRSSHRFLNAFIDFVS